MLRSTRHRAAKKETRKWAGGGAIRVWSNFHSTLVPEEFCPHIVVPVNNSASGFNHLSPYQTSHGCCDGLEEKRDEKKGRQGETVHRGRLATEDSAGCQGKEYC